MNRTPSETSALNDAVVTSPEQRAAPQPNTESFLTSFVYEEVTEALLSTLHRIVPLLPPTVRVKLLAFVQLLQDPETVTASFALQSSGNLRLILAVGNADDGVTAQTEPPHASASAGRSP